MQVQRSLLKNNIGLSVCEPASIGFDDLVVKTTGRDSNTTLVYLYGFSDCMTIFTVYKLYALEGTTVLDVGSNLGIHSMVLSKCVGVEGRVMGFEAIDSIYSKSLENIEENDIRNVEMKNVGVGETEERVLFDDNSDDCNVGKGNVSEEGTRRLQLSTIDRECGDCKQSISLVKLDLEGYELKALKGAQETLNKHKPVVMCEFNKESYSFDDLKDAIPYECNVYVIPYTFYEKVEGYREGKNMYGELLFVPVEKKQPPQFLNSKNA